MNKISRRSTTIIPALFFVFATGFVTFTPDKLVYQYWIKENEARDQLFSFLLLLGKNDPDFYQTLHLILMSLVAYSFYKFSRICGTSAFLGFAYILIFNYIAVTTQIRFYSAYFLLLLGYVIYAKEKFKIRFLFFTAVAIGLHFSVVMVVAAMSAFSIQKRTTVGKAIFATVTVICLALVISTFFSPQIIIEYTRAYFDSNNISSIVGGIIAISPNIYWFMTTMLVFPLSRYNRREEYSHKTRSTNTTDILYKFIIVHGVFLLPGVFLKIVGDRLTDSIGLFSLLYLSQIFSKCSRIGRRNIILVASIGLTYQLAHTYTLDYFLYGSFDKTSILAEMLSSIEFRLIWTQ